MTREELITKVSAVKVETTNALQLLFDELNTFTVTYNNKWKNVTIGENSLDKKQKCETPYLFYFEEGKTYSLKMEVTLLHQLNHLNYY